LQAFKDFWANPGFGIEGEPGITTYFQREDADFFLLDNRYHRSPNQSKSDDKTILGSTQKQWLKDNLLSSKATFKFVAVGGQFLNTATKYENFANYAKERQELINFIQQNNIKNVIFLTGDRHHSEISKLAKEGSPTIYDITSSPLTSGAGNSAKYETNALQVEGSLIMGKRNFTALSLEGELKNRKLTITYFDKEGNKLYTYTIEAE
jgi:alkaline phosphatase D